MDRSKEVLIFAVATPVGQGVFGEIPNGFL